MESYSKTNSDNFSYERLEKLRQTHPTLKLLNADNAPFIISFLYLLFIQPNKRSIPYTELVSRLDDYLYHLRQIYGEEKYPRPAKEYLEEWANHDNAFLRKYYVASSDEPECDLMPATEKAIEWLQSLEQKQFIGTESRLLTMLQLLRDMVNKTQQDPQLRITELERQKAALEEEIAKVRAGTFDFYDARQIKERFVQIEDTARKLLSDFRQIEYNFRLLDHEARERIATSTKNKGELLDDIFQEQDIIQNSDQGKSFKAFWELLMLPARQHELRELITRLLQFSEVQSLVSDNFLINMHFYLLEAGEKVYRTSVLLGEQLRKYLDDQTYLENKRIMELIKNIEKNAIVIKHNPPTTPLFAKIDESKPSLDLIMSRSLFAPPKNPLLDNLLLQQGQADIAVDILYQQPFVDEAALLANIRRALQSQSQISLGQLIEKFPLRKGLAEIITYLHLANKSNKATIDSEKNEIIILQTNQGIRKQIKLPQIIFVT